MAGRPSRLELYRRLDDALDEVNARLGGLPTPTQAEGIWTSIWHVEAHHSTAIEGNTLVLRQVEALLRDGRAIGHRELREYLEVQGYAAAARWVYEQARTPGDWSDGSLISVTEVRHIHAMALGPVWDVAPHPAATSRESPGSFREHDIAAFPDGMKPPSWVEVPAQLHDWVSRLEKVTQAPTRIEAWAAAHGEFERIHPFLDGNGRAGRLVLNLLLLRVGLAPVIVHTRDRNRYLAGLRAADRGDSGPLGELLARAVLDNLYRFIVPAVGGPDELVPLGALSTRSVTETALRVAANRGRLQAQKGSDGLWRSTTTWVEEYVASRRRRAD